ncbi:MAG: DNA translocase FtsK 4TM domain-containing protein, partial [Steroidobacteraceae bacterium]
MAKTAGDTATSEAKLHPVFAHALRESAFWLLAALALVLMIALSSYDAYDRSFSYTGEPGQVGNLIGPLGAWVSGFLLMLFGWPAYLFPLAIGFSAWVGLKRAPDEPGHGRSTIALRTIGLVAALGTSCALAALHFAPGVLPAGAGGILGNLIGGGLTAAASLLGATLLMLALWFVGVQLYTGVSWLRVMDFIGHGVLAAAGWIRDRMATQRDQAAGRESREAREALVREVQKKTATRTPPRIETAAPQMPEPSQRVEKEKQVQLFARPAAKDLPELKLLDDPPAREKTYSPEALDAISRLVEIKLKDFGVDVEVVAVLPG